MPECHSDKSSQSELQKFNACLLIIDVQYQLLKALMQE